MKLESHPAGQHEPASALFMKIRGSFMAIRVKNKSLEYRPEANCHLSFVICQLKITCLNSSLNSVDKIILS